MRGAGFPACEALEFGAESVSRAADEILRLKKELAAARELALESCKRFPEGADRVQRKGLRKLRDRIWKGRPPGPKVDLEAEAIAHLRRIWAEIERSHGEFDDLFAEAQRKATATLLDRVQSSRFREALLWQNPALFRGITRFRDLSLGIGKPADRRNHEVTLLRYLYRYTTKNDTIGFFGPTGWGLWSDAQGGAGLVPGADFLGDRRVYFEGWCIDTLAASLAADPKLQPWLKPRLSPLFGLLDGELFPPGMAAQKLPPATAAVLELCQGQLSAREIAGRLTGPAGTAHFRHSDEVLGLLQELVAQEIVHWNLEGPLEIHPEESLRRALEEVRELELREGGLGRLAELEAARQVVASSAGDPEALQGALEELNQKFERLTGESPTRNAGQIYAARTLVYEDCRRDSEIVFGRSILEAAGGPLSLLLDSARWLTHRSAEIHRQTFREVYHQLSALKGSGRVHAVDFWATALERLNVPGRSPKSASIAAFQERWAEVLAILPEEGNRVQRTSEELRPRVQEHFEAAGPGWPNALYHSPDMMIAAKGMEALQNGDFLLVLGELHAASNTLGTPSTMDLQTTPGEIERAYSADRPAPWINIAFDKAWPWNTARTKPALWAKDDFILEYGPEPSGATPDQVLKIGDFVVEEQDGELFFCRRSGGQRFEALELCGNLISTQTASSFRMLPGQAHSPRVTIDRLVVSRESWRLEVGQIPWLAGKRAEDRFIEARAWGQELGMPRFVFFNLPIEPKPCFLDFDSPLSLDIFSRRLRKASELKGAAALAKISEMLPRPDQLWLHDAEGRHYTSELRLVAVDPREFIGRHEHI